MLRRRILFAHKLIPTLIPPENKSLTYTGSAQDLITPGSVKHGTLYYKLNNGEYSESIPKGTDAGNYNVYYKVIGDKYFEDIEEQLIVCTINRASISYTKPEAIIGLTYTDSSQSLCTSGSTNVGTIQYKLESGSYSTTIPKGINAGFYNITWKINANSNYQSVGPESFEVEIDKATPQLGTITARTLTYTGNAQQLINSVTTSGGTVQYKLSTDNTWSTSIPKETDAGKYVVNVKSFGNDNYYDSVIKSVNCEIYKADLTIVAPKPISGLYYNGSAQTLCTAGSSSPIGTMQYKLDSNSWSTVLPSATEIGTYTIYYKVDSSNTNYNSYSAHSITVVISDKIVPTVTPPTAASTSTYNGNVRNLLSKAGSTTGGTMQYSLDYSDWSTTIPMETNAGTYKIYYRSLGNDMYATVQSTNMYVTCTINKEDLTVTPPKAKSGLYYNGSSHTLCTAGSVSPSSAGIMKYKLGSESYSTALPSATAVGTYTIYYKVDSSNTNYNSYSEHSITAVISDKIVPTVTAPTGVTLTYNGSDRNLLSNEGSTTGGTMQYKLGSSGSWSTSIPQATNADTYYVYYRSLGNDTYATVESSDMYITSKINKKDLTVTPPTAKSLIYNGSAQTLCTAGSSSPIGIMQYKIGSNGTYSTTLPSATAVGTYTIYYKVDGNSNYNSYENSITVVISDKTVPTVNAPTGVTLTYNGSARNLLSNEGSTTGGTMQYKLGSGGSWSTSIPQATNADTYYVYYRSLGNDTYATVESSDMYVTCIINPITITITKPTAKSLTYSGSAQPLCNAGSVSPSAGGTIQYSLNNSSWQTTIPTATNANTYTIYWRINVNTPNYTAGSSATSGNVSTTISKANLSITAPKPISGLKYDGSSHTLCTAGSSSPIGTMQYKIGRNGTYSTTLPSASAVGTYTIYYKVDGNSNYNSYENSITAVISKKTVPTVNAPTGVTLTYNGSARNLLSNEGSTTGGTMQYSLDYSNWSTSIPQATNADTYYVYYRSLGDDTYETVQGSNMNVRCTINKKPLVINNNPTPKSLTYNGSAKDLCTAGSVDPSSAGTMQYKVNNGSYSTNIPTGISAGNYTVWYKGVSNNNNYSDTTEYSITCTINTQPITITAPTPKSGLTYNGSAQYLCTAGSVNPSSAGTIQYCLSENGTYSTNIPTGISAGNYTVWYKGVSNNNNYSDTPKYSIICTINQKSVSVNPPTPRGNLEYTGSAQTLHNDGSFIEPSSGYFKYSSDAGSSWSDTTSATEAGKYTILWRAIPTDTTNYSITRGSMTCYIDSVTAFYITRNGSGLSGVSVKLNSTNTTQTTNSNGYTKFTNLTKNTSYNYTLSYSNYTWYASVTSNNNYSKNFEDEYDIYIPSGYSASKTVNYDTTSVTFNFQIDYGCSTFGYDITSDTSNVIYYSSSNITNYSINGTNKTVTISFDTNTSYSSTSSHSITLSYHGDTQTFTATQSSQPHTLSAKAVRTQNSDGEQSQSVPWTGGSYTFYVYLQYDEGSWFLAPLSSISIPNDIDDRLSSLSKGSSAGCVNYTVKQTSTYVSSGTPYQIIYTGVQISYNGLTSAAGFTILQNLKPHTYSINCGYDSITYTAEPFGSDTLNEVYLVTDGISGSDVSSSCTLSTSYSWIHISGRTWTVDSTDDYSDSIVREGSITVNYQHSSGLLTDTITIKQQGKPNVGTIILKETNGLTGWNYEIYSEDSGDFVNSGTNVSFSTVTAYDIPAGNWIINISKDGYKDIYDTLSATIDGGSSETVKFALQKNDNYSLVATASKISYTHGNNSGYITSAYVCNNGVQQGSDIKSSCTLSSDVDWITVSNQSWLLSVFSEHEKPDRTGTITVSYTYNGEPLSYKIVITQSCAPNLYTISWLESKDSSYAISSYEAGSDGGATFKYNITKNGSDANDYTSVTVESSKTWLSFKPYYSLKDIDISWTANDETSPRTADLTLTYHDKTLVAHITQPGKPVPTVPTITANIYIYKNGQRSTDADIEMTGSDEEALEAIDGGSLTLNQNESYTYDVNPVVGVSFVSIVIDNTSNGTYTSASSTGTITTGTSNMNIKVYIKNS